MTVSRLFCREHSIRKEAAPLTMATRNDDQKAASRASTDFEEWPTGVDEFPSIFRETTVMTFGAIIIFILADLRRMARGNLLHDEDNALLLKLPIQGKALAPILERNTDVLKNKMKKIEFEVFHRLVDEYKWRCEKNKREIEGAECYYIGDEHSSKECVYAIIVNHVRKNITLIFRGSITLQDWFQVNIATSHYLQTTTCIRVSELVHLLDRFLRTGKPSFRTSTILCSDTRERISKGLDRDLLDEKACLISTAF